MASRFPLSIYAWWPLPLVFVATAWLWQPVLKLFWYRDDYPLLYWLMYPAGPTNPADIGDFKLPIYHGLLQLHWPAFHLFGLNPTLHRAGQLGLLLVAVGLAYWLAHQVSQSHLVAALSSLLLATTPVALAIAERVSLAYQGYLVVAFTIGNLLLLLKWQSSKDRRWLLGAGVLFLMTLYFVGVRLHAAFIGLGAFALWLGWPDRTLRRQALWFIGFLTIATLGLVAIDGLGRNHLSLASTVLPDFLGSLGNLLLPTTGVGRLFQVIESDPVAIVQRYQWLVLCISALALVGTALLTDLKRRPVQMLLGLIPILGIGFWLAHPMVLMGDRTAEAKIWLSWLAGSQTLILLAALGWSWHTSRYQQIMLLGLTWAILSFLPAFLVQPGAPFGTTDKYFVSAVPGLILLWIGGLSWSMNHRRWILPISCVGLILGSGWLVRTDLATQSTDRASPARAIHTALRRFSIQWPAEARIVLLAPPSTRSAYQLHEALAASTIHDEAIFTVLYGLPYDTRYLRLANLAEVAAELERGVISPQQVFVYQYQVETGLSDLSNQARILLNQPGTTTDSASITVKLNSSLLPL